MKTKLGNLKKHKPVYRISKELEKVVRANGMVAWVPYDKKYNFGYVLDAAQLYVSKGGRIRMRIHEKNKGGKSVWMYYEVEVIA